MQEVPAAGNVVGRPCAICNKPEAIGYHATGYIPRRVSNMVHYCVEHREQVRTLCGLANMLTCTERLRGNERLMVKYEAAWEPALDAVMFPPPAELADWQRRAH